MYSRPEALPANDREFYPTPPRLADAMLRKVDLRSIHTVLEPSAGKGDILRQLARREDKLGCYSHHFDIDCIELDPNLRQILKYNYSNERKHQFDRKDPEYGCFFEEGIHIVHDDFLTFRPFKQYDLIIMNPPFVDGDKHLLKALEIQRDGGKIVCLLNAETIRNPYTKTRQYLVEQLENLEAQIEYVSNAFVAADRQTSVEIAIVYVDIAETVYESPIYDKLRKSESHEEYEPDELNEIEVTDMIKATVQRFNVEVLAGIELIRQYRALVPYIRSDFTDKSNAMLRLTDTCERSYESVKINSYVRLVRAKYWRGLLNNPQFTSRLTAKLQDMYREQVESLSHYDFSEFNIRVLIAEMNSKLKSGVEAEIDVMFQRLTEAHSWYPECAKNVHYYDGWKTNKATKIGKRVILPCYGVYSSWDGEPHVYEARKTIEDIERILNYFAGHMSADIDSWARLQDAFSQHQTKNIELKYFTVTFYKKGTVHIVFNCPEIIDRYNIYVGKDKNWLPPNYGRVRYENMQAEERSVVDNFNGDGKAGSGEQAYSEILKESEYYLSSPVGSLLMLTGGDVGV